MNVRERMDEEKVHTDEEAAVRARRYSRIREWFVLVDLLWSGAVSVAALTTGLSAWLRDRARDVPPRRLGPVMPYVAGASLLSFLASLPLSFVRGFVVEKRFGLSNQTV